MTAERLLDRGEASLRFLAVGCLSMVAAFHAMWVPHKLEEAPYMAVLFILLVLGSLAGAVILCLAGARLARPAWAFAGVLAASPLAGYVLSRIVALPQQEHVVGGWQDALGLPSIAVEGFLVGLAVARLSGWKAGAAEPANSGAPRAPEWHRLRRRAPGMP